MNAKLKVYLSAYGALEAKQENGTITDLGEQLQRNYPGAVVQQIYPVEEKNLNM